MSSFQPVFPFHRTFSYSQQIQRLRALYMFLLVCAGVACAEPVPRECAERLGFEEVDAAVFVSVDGDERREPEPLCIDKYPASRLDASSASPGRDESFAASQPGVIPWTGMTFREANLACGRGGKFLCAADVLQGVASGPGEMRNALEPIEDFEVTGRDTFYGGVEIGAVPLPGANGSMVFISSDRQLVGDIIGTGVVMDGYPGPLPVPGFSHPLVGFRCCIDSRVRDLFVPLGSDPGLIRENDPDVPVAVDGGGE